MKTSDVTILCVDDSKMVHKFVHSVLKESFKKLYFANDGLEGIEKYKKLKPNIVLADINMPRMDGIEMLKKIKAINPKAIVVMMTTESANSLVTKAAENGISGYINKSNAKNELKPTIEKLAKLIIKTRNRPKEKQESYEYLQPFLELSNEMSILTDGVNIFSCNKLFLDFVEVASIHDFIANYASIEYLVESIEDIDDERLNSNNWIKLLYEIPEGRKVTILNYQSSTRVTLLAKVAKIPSEKDLYAVILFKENKCEDRRKDLSIFNFFTQTLSQQFFSAQLPLLLENSKNHNITITIISLRIASIEKESAQREEIIKIVELLNKETLAKDMLFSYKQGFLVVCLDSEITETKLKAKLFAQKIKAFYAPNPVRAKLGFIGLNTTEALDKEVKKIESYLQKFHNEKIT